MSTVDYCTSAKIGTGTVSQLCENTKALTVSVKAIEEQMVSIMQNEMGKNKDTEVAMIKNQLAHSEKNYKEEKKSTKLGEEVQTLSKRVADLEAAGGSSMIEHYETALLSLETENSILMQKLLPYSTTETPIQDRPWTVYRERKVD